MSQCNRSMVAAPLIIDNNQVSCQASHDFNLVIFYLLIILTWIQQAVPSWENTARSWVWQYNSCWDGICHLSHARLRGVSHSSWSVLYLFASNLSCSSKPQSSSNSLQGFWKSSEMLREILRLTWSSIPFYATLNNSTQTELFETFACRSHL